MSKNILVTGCSRGVGLEICRVLLEQGNTIYGIARSHTEEFKIYDVADGKIISSAVVSTMGNGHGALAGFLSVNKVDVLICGGIGGGAQTALAQAGIKLYGGVSGDADEAVNAFLNGTLGYNPDVKCSHHSHEHNESAHSCGSHGCGNHGCH